MLRRRQHEPPVSACCFTLVYSPLASSPSALLSLLSFFLFSFSLSPPFFFSNFLIFRLLSLPFPSSLPFFSLSFFTRSFLLSFPSFLVFFFFSFFLLLFLLSLLSPLSLFSFSFSLSSQLPDPCRGQEVEPRDIFLRLRGRSHSRGLVHGQPAEEFEEEGEGASGRRSSSGAG